MKNKINKWLKVSLFLAMILVSTGIFAQTTVNLTTHEGTVPSGYTIKWFKDINHTTEVSDKSAVGEGTYYAFLSQTGASPVCLTGPATLKVLAIACGASSIDLSANISASTTPSGATLTFHNNVNPAEANQLSGTAISAAGTGTYYVSFRTGATSAEYCYSNSTPVVVINRNCSVVKDDINQTPAGTAVSGSVVTNDSGLATTNPVTAATYTKADGTTAALSLGVATNVYGKDEAGNTVLAGSMTLNSDGTYSFTPASGFSGNVPVTYTAQDVNGSTSSATLNIKVVGETSNTGNNPLVAQNDTATVQTNEGTSTNSVSVNVLSNDSSTDGNTLSVSSVSAITSNDGTTTSNISTNPSAPTTVYDKAGNEAGTAYIDGTGKVVFTPKAAYTGNVPFTTTVTDNASPTPQTAASVLTITVAPRTATEEVYPNDDAQAFKEGTTEVTGNVLTNDTTSGTGTTTVTAATVNGTALTMGTEADLGANIGKLTLNANGTYTFKPAFNFVGTVPVVYTSCVGTAPNQSCKKATLYLSSLAKSVCVFTPTATGTDAVTPIGISTQEHNTENWVTDRNGFIKLESQKLGFIPTRLSTVQRDGLTAAQGMIIWNTDNKCLEIYTGTIWKCVTKGCNK